MPKYVLPGATGLLVRGNIDIDARSYVAVPVGGGKFASVRATSWWIAEGEDPNDFAAVGEVYRHWRIKRPPRRGFWPNILVPEVIRVGHQWKAVPGKRAFAHAMKTGRHLGIFDTPSHATIYANKLHLMQAAAGKRHRTRTR